MAKRSSNLTGLEIEPSGVHAVWLAGPGPATIGRSASAPLPAGVVREGEVADPEALAAVLRDLFATHKLDRRVRVGIANQKIVVRVIELPPIDNAKELDAAVRFSAQDEIPMPLDAAVVDYQALDVVQGPDGPRQRVVLVAARRDMVDNVLAAVRGAGLRPEGLDLAAFGMVRALHHFGAGEDEATLYLSVGGLTNLAMARGRTCVFTRVVGGGLEAVAAELAERRGLTLEHARGWLEHTGLREPLETLEGFEEHPEILHEARTVLTDGMRRIATEVRTSLDFHGGFAAHCVLTGPAAALDGFDEALSGAVGLPVRVGAVQGPDGLRLSVAAGLALREAAA